MYANSYSVADLNRAPNMQRGQRSLHGSQSHANFHFGGGASTTGNLNAGGFNDSITAAGGLGGSVGGFGAGSQQQQQYMPGYLLSASQGQVGWTRLSGGRASSPFVSLSY